MFQNQLTDFKEIDNAELISFECPAYIKCAIRKFVIAPFLPRISQLYYWLLFLHCLAVQSTYLIPRREKIRILPQTT